MDNGWIKIHRKLLDWEWYDEPNTFRLFMHLLLKANHKPKKHRGKTIKAGQIMTGIHLLSAETKLSIRQVRTSLTRLKSTNEIVVNSSSQGTVIHIVKYIDYQITDKPTTNKRQANDKPTTNQRQTNDKRATTNKNDKNVKNVKNEEEDKEEKSFVTDFNPDSFYAIESLFKPYLQSEKIIDALLKNKKYGFTSKEHIRDKLREFVKLRIESGELMKTPTDFASHFRNWIVQKKTISEIGLDKNGRNASDRIPIG